MCSDDAMQTPSERICDVARKIFGYETLRPGQKEAIVAVLAGHDTLAVMPTGSGKSAIYQIPALLLAGPTVVISPLIALQKDQSEELNRHDVGGAVVLNSLISDRAQEKALAEVEDGQVEFLFLAPEQFSNARRLAAVKAASPSLVVIDEAHCITEWGHSFRPDYLRLRDVIEELGHPTVLALTATANEKVRAEIVNRLGLRDPKIFVNGFDRPNIWFGVEVAASETKKRAMLLDRIQNTERPGIVYTTTRKHAEEIRDELNNVNIPSAYYHGALKKTERELMQEQFMEGDVEVIVATSAFGMGVDKANVRFVFHFEPPDSIDSYYQEIGRAGRDGRPASTVLFYNPQDLGIHKFFKGGGQICTADVQHVLDILEYAGELEATDLQERSGLSRTKFSRVLNRLEECEAIVLSLAGTIRLADNSNGVSDVAAEASSMQADLHKAELQRIENMRTYAESMECRRAYLINYFGEPFGSDCGNCDNCQGGGTERALLVKDLRLRAAQECAPSSSRLTGLIK
jgi:ATP-dependent DNA helicase RecQ